MEEETHHVSEQQTAHPEGVAAHRDLDMRPPGDLDARTALDVLLRFDGRVDDAQRADLDAVQQREHEGARQAGEGRPGEVGEGGDEGVHVV